MFLDAHSGGGLYIESKCRSRDGAHIFLEEYETVPQCNETIVTISQIIKFVMSSASGAELGVLFTTAKEIVLMRLKMIDMGRPQTPLPIQTDKSMAESMVNNTIITRKTNSMYL